MPTKQQHYIGLPEVAAADGATTPDPGILYCVCWSTVENGLVAWDGSSWRTAAGSQLGGSTEYEPAAIAHGATTPTAALYTPRFSTLENDLIVWNGSSWRIAGKGAVTKLYALRFADNTQRMATQATGGELGVSTGFGNITLGYMRRLPATYTIMRSKTGSAGWSHTLGPSLFRLDYYNGSSWLYHQVNFGASLVGRIVVFLSRITATPGVLEASIDGVWAPTAAIAGYAGASTAECIGDAAGAGFPSVDVDILAGVDFRGVPTRAQLDAYVLAARALGDLPSTMNGATITHRKSLKETLAGTTVVAGQVAPASLPDTITAAAADISTRSGSPTIAEIDVASIDGRKTYGVLGFTTPAYLQCNSYRGASSGFWFGVAFTFFKLPTQAQHAFSCFGTSGQGGYSISQGDNALLSLDIYTAAGTYTQYGGGTVTLLSTELYTPLLLVVVFTGSVWRIYLSSRRAQVGADKANTYMPQTAFPMNIGRAGYAAEPSVNLRFEGVVGSDAHVPSAAEVLTLIDAFNTTGRIASIPAKTQHLHDTTLDIAATGSAAAGVPALFLDRVSSDPLVRCGLGIDGPPSGLKGISGHSTANNYASLTAAGGLPGATTGWWVEALIYYRAPAADAGLIWNTASNGWYINIAPNGVYVVIGGSGGTSTIAMTNNAWHHVLCFWNNPGLWIYVDGVWGNNQNYPTYIVGTSALSTYSAGHDTVIAGISGGNSIPTAGEIATASAAALANLSVAGIPGKTLRRWAFDLDIAEAGGAMPATITDRISGLPANQLRSAGAGLVSSRRVERAWSVEATPISYGANAFASGVHYAGSANLTDMVGACWCTLVFTPELDVTGGTRILLSSNGNSSQGITFYSSGAHTGVYFGVSTSAGFYQVQGGALSASDLGKKVIVTGFFNGTAIQMLHRRVLETSAATSGTLGVGTAPLYVGSEPGGSPRPATYTTIHGWAMGLGVPTLGELQSQYDAIIAADGDVQPIPGKTLHLHSLLRDQVGGSTAPATLTDKQGSYTMTRAGSPALVPGYTRVFAA